MEKNKNYGRNFLHNTDILWPVVRDFLGNDFLRPDFSVLFFSLQRSPKKGKRIPFFGDKIAPWLGKRE
jgi:hypothetical protein